MTETDAAPFLGTIRKAGSRREAVRAFLERLGAHAGAIDDSVHRAEQVYDHAEPLERGGFFPRTPLAYALSSDGGLSWGEPCVIDHHLAREFIYPSICMVPEGVLIVYSEHYTENRFGSDSPEERLIGGGKRCILAYPDH